MGETRKILVTGATGKQGGAVARQLLAAGWPIRALTRDPAKPEARALADQGGEVVRADLDDPGSLAAALKGVYGAYSVQNFWETGYEREVAQGKRLVDVAREAGVQHFVYSSVGGAERRTGLTHFDSKWEIEEHLRASGLAWTIIRPAFFMDNFLGQQLREGITQGQIAMGMRPDTELQMVAVDDIGRLAAAAFADPEKWGGEAFELAGDELTMPEVARRFSALLGKPVQYVELTNDQVAAWSREYADMFKWFDDYGYQADIAWLRETYPPLQTFDQWLEQTWPG